MGEIGRTGPGGLDLGRFSAPVSASKDRVHFTCLYDAFRPCLSPWHVFLLCSATLGHNEVRHAGPMGLVRRGANESIDLLAAVPPAHLAWSAPSGRASRPAGRRVKIQCWDAWTRRIGDAFVCMFARTCGHGHSDFDR